MKIYAVEIRGITINFRKSMRAKRIIINIKPGVGVRVTVPNMVSFQTASEFVTSKINWIEGNLKKISSIEKRHKYLPVDNSPLSRVDAREKLVQRLEYLSDRNSFTYNRVFVRNQKTRWGSCSDKNNINLNINLARLPDEMVDYVILHELVHTRIKNHSKSFWSELDKYIAGSKSIDLKLNKYCLGLFAKFTN